MSKGEASEAHGLELQELRAKSHASIEELSASHKLTLESLRADHATALGDHNRELEKQGTQSTLDLKATRDDLAKAKNALEGARAEIATLTLQLEQAQAVTPAEPIPSPEQEAEIKRLQEESAYLKDDLKAVREALDLTKQSLSDSVDNHSKELEEAAKSRVEEATRLRSNHDEELRALLTQKTDLASRLSDLEGELATLKAAPPVQAAPSPKVNGGAQAPSNSAELQRLHEAHNLKMADLQAEHEKALAAAQENHEATLSKTGELNEEIARKVTSLSKIAL